MWCFVWCGVASEMMWLAGVWLWRASVVVLGSRVCGGCLVGVGVGEGDVAWCGCCVAWCYRDVVDEC